MKIMVLGREVVIKIIFINLKIDYVADARNFYIYMNVYCIDIVYSVNGE